MSPYDIMVVGGGIVGLATALQLLKLEPGLSVIVVEKEARVAAHQSGRNSGVLHTGVYYRPGSLRARYCVEGRALMKKFCMSESIPVNVCGKVIVATKEDEIPRLEALYSQAMANGVVCEKIGPGELEEIEPFAAGLAALHIPDAAVLDYSVVCERMAKKIKDLGGVIRLGVTCLGLETQSNGVKVRTNSGEFLAGRVINCAGLHSDRVAKMGGANPAAQVIPFRGEFFALRGDATRYCKGLIYPVPDPRFPFLGVHLTKQIDGGVICGPNAVVALKREGYRWGDIGLRDMAETFTFPGVLRFTAKNWAVGISEIWRSLSRRRFLHSLQKLVPELQSDDLVPAPSGVRAQAMSRDGMLVDDFLIQKEARVLHVVNAPSPAATSSLSIGATVAERALNGLCI